MSNTKKNSKDSFFDKHSLAMLWFPVIFTIIFNILVAVLLFHDVDGRYNNIKHELENFKDTTNKHFIDVSYTISDLCSR